MADTSNHITKVAIVGASGNVGSVITTALLKTGRHTITAVTRADSESKSPEGVHHTKEVDYNKPETVTDALRGQDALIICLGGRTPPDVEMTLINAAGEAGVPWIFPSEWGIDTANEALLKDNHAFEKQVKIRKAISDLGKSSYIALVTGFWLEWSLAIPPAFGFDFANRAVTLYDNGDVKMCVSTWPQVGRAVAALLSLPVQADGGADLDQIRNKVVYIKSFTVSQRDMWESARRVTGTEEGDWTVTKESSQERYVAGVEQMKQGDIVGFVKMLYVRPFYPDSCGDFEHKGLLNGLLGLPAEDLDESVKAGIERSKVVSFGA